MVQLFHVSKFYDKRPALSDVSIEIGKGDFVLLMGASGAGKSTLLKLLFRAELPDEGQVLIQDRNVARLRPSEVPALRRNMGVVFQDFRLLPKKSVYDNVAMPLLVQGKSAFEIRMRVVESLNAVGLSDKRECRPSMLSAGEQQRACIARAIVNNPVLLVADEPTGNLDPVLAGDILDRFKTINARGTTVVLASHDPLVRARLSCRVVTLSQGRIETVEGAAS
jgi:cell division transport system ATP-binding protein